MCGGRRELMHKSFSDGWETLSYNNKYMLLHKTWKYACIVETDIKLFIRGGENIQSTSNMPGCRLSMELLDLKNLAVGG